MQVVDSEGYLKVKLVGGPVGPFVPYTGATANVDLGEYEIKAGQLELDQTPTGTAGVAVMRWNDQDGTADLGLKGGNVTLQVGQEQVTRVVNKTGVNLLEANYQAVRVDGAQGNRLKVALAQANNDANSADTLGLVTETINNNQEGFVTVSGLVRNINTTGSIQTETWLDGDVLYLSGTVAGQITNVKPTAPIHTVIMGYVVRAHATQGQIYVKVDNGYELDELHNVAIVTPLNDQVLQYETATSLWKNKTISSGITIGTTAITSGTVGRVLFEGTGNVVQESANLFWDNTNGRLGIGTSSPVVKYHQSQTQGIFARYDITNANADQNRGVFEFYTNTAVTPDFFGRFGFKFEGGINNASRQFQLHVGDNTTPRFVVNGSGNVLIGTITDAGYRLDVNGTARVKGSGTTSATTSLLIQNSAGVNLLQVRDDNLLTYASALTLSQTGTRTTFSTSGGTNVNHFRFTTLSSLSSPTGNTVFLDYIASFTPTSGVGTFSALSYTGVINQTGGANGITRGLYINPTLTAAADFRAIETTAGNVIFNGGNVGIGTSSPANKLDVVGTIRATLITTPLIYTTGSDTLTLATQGGTSAVTVFPTTRNVVIQNGGSHVDAGFRLDVNGTARVQGVLTAAGNYIQYGTNPNVGIGSTNNGNSFVNNGPALLYASANISATQVYAHNFFTGSFNSTSGVQGLANLAGANFSPTSGTAVFNTINATPTINQTGGANGITRGLYVNPTLTSAFDFKAIETTAGNVIFNGGNVGIGTSSPQGALHIAVATGTPALVLSDVGSPNTLPTLQFRRGPLSAYSLQIDYPSNIKARFSIGDAVTGYEITGGNVGLTGGRSIEFGGITGQAVTAILGSVHTDNNNGQLFFSTRGSGTLAERMRIFTTGNIGINTTTDAGYKLDVNGTARVSGLITTTGGLASTGGLLSSQTGANSGRMTLLNLRNTGGGFLSGVGTSMAIAFTNREVGGIWSDDFIELKVYNNGIGTTTTGYNFYTHNNQAYLTASALAMSINGGSVGIGIESPNVSAKMQIESTTQGFLPPRMTTTQKNAIASPATGLMVYDNVLNRPCFYDGTTWITL